MNKDLETETGIEKKMPEVTFNGNKYFYKWKPVSGILCIYMILNNVELKQPRPVIFIKNQKK